MGSCGRLRHFFLSALCALAARSFAQSVPVDKYTLGNGMTVILDVDHTVPLVAVNIWYYVGSKDEPPHHSGFAHLFEHLMFMGTHRVPTGMYDKIMEGGGGNNNASTEEDRTNFYDFGPSNLLPTLLWLEADRLEDLGRFMTQKKLNLQRDVVKNERRQNTENTPYGTAYERINGLTFPAGHPYHTSVIGSMADLDRASVADVQKFFATYYVPNNASLVVAGDFDPAKIKPYIAKMFGTLPRRPPVPRKPSAPIGYIGVKTLTLRDKVQAPKLIMVWHSPAAYKPGDLEMQLTGSVLSDGLSSRLYQRLVVKDRLATDVSASQEERLLGSLFYVDVTATQGADLKGVKADVDDELTRFKRSGPTKAELTRQSAKLQSGVLNGLQSIQNVADALNSYEFYLGKPNAFKQELDKVRRATPEQVRAAAAAVLSLDNRLILTVLPGPTVTGGSAPLRFGKSKIENLKSADPRDTRPPIGTPKPYTAPEPVDLKLQNGITLHYWQRRELPLMTLSLYFGIGANEDAVAKAGQSSLAAALLTQGAGKRDSKAYQNALDLLGASVGAAAARADTDVSLNVLAANFTPALALYADAVLRPRFDVKEFVRVKRVTVADLEQQRDDVDAVSSQVATRELFGNDSIYGVPVSGTPATVSQLSLQDVKDAYRRDFNPALATFFGAGSLPPEAVKRALEQQFATWHSRPAPPKTEPKLDDTYKGPIKLVIVDKPGAPQTAVRFISANAPYQNPDRLELEEIDTILGGSFTSRLNQDLREDKGYTYGAGSGYVKDLKTGYFIAAAQVRTDVTGASLKEFIRQFDKLGIGDITPAEVRKATSSMRSDRINTLETIQGIVDLGASLKSVNRPFTALTEDEKTLERLTAKRLNAAEPHVLDFHHGIWVLVGDKAKILPQLKDVPGLPEPIEVKAD